MQLFVRDNDVTAALGALKRKMQGEGVFREMKRRSASLGTKGAAKSRGIRQYCKAMRKRLEREGY